MKLYLLKTIRTNNFTDTEMVEKISTAWQESVGLIGEQVAVIYGVYHNYAGNYRDDYDLSIGTTIVATTDEIVIPSEDDYKVFTVDMSLENPVFQGWQRIWQEEESGDLKRAYGIDYEKYELDGRVSIYISVEKF